MKKRQYTTGQTFKMRFDGKYLSSENVNTDFSLRDRFALEAMKVILESKKVHRLTPKNRIKCWMGMKCDSIISLPNLKKLAIASYTIADTMIAERELKTNEGQ